MMRTIPLLFLALLSLELPAAQADGSHTVMQGTRMLTVRQVESEVVVTDDTKEVARFPAPPATTLSQVIGGEWSAGGLCLVAAFTIGGRTEVMYALVESPDNGGRFVGAAPILITSDGVSLLPFQRQRGDAIAGEIRVNSRPMTIRFRNGCPNPPGPAELSFVIDPPAGGVH